MNLDKNDSAVAHYLTFGCFRRKHLFLNVPLCELFTLTLDQWRRDEGLHLYAWVILANHVHLLIFREEGVLSSSIRKLKQTFGFQALAWIQDQRPSVYRNLGATDHGRDVHRFWQSGGGYDRGIYSNEALRKAVDYIHNNPVKANLVDFPDEYKWSSARAWATGRADPISIDVPEWWWRVYK